MTIENGFPGQRMVVLPRPLVEAARSSRGTSHLCAVAGGYFPHATRHGMLRAVGITEAIVIACVKGSGWYRTEAGTRRISAGQLLIIPPGVAHSYGSDPTDPWTLWWVHLLGRDLAELIGEIGPSAEEPVRRLTNPYRVVSLIEEIVGHLEHDSTASSQMAAAGAAWHLLAMIIADRSSAGSKPSVIEQAKEYLRHNYAESIPVGELAAMSRLSPSHFATLFKQQVGTPVIKYQTDVRMAKARELLDLTDLPVSRIAADVGYADAFYFGRQFKSIHGLSPLKYRAQNKG